jgi:Na+(H+)/acetate symporter ActP
VFISLQLTGVAIPQLGLGADLVGQNESLLNKLDQVVTDLGFGQYTTSLPGSTLNMFMYTLSLMIGTAGLPHVIMRFFTVPSVKDARSSAGWALVFIAILYTTAPAVAAMAKTNLIRTVTPGVVMQDANVFDKDLATDEASVQRDASAPATASPRSRRLPAGYRTLALPRSTDNARRIAARARDNWLFDVPGSMSSIVAISSCVYPSTSCSTSTIR